ncbi:MAG: response regulator [Bacteroidales bacterium]|nr:response regulator [Bacteroidales bacterium]MCM1415050.1 response regulator [bacterium]MCM1422904.1 response regulator [bacterium]
MMETEASSKKAPIILIVDDISVNVTILENILVHEGYETITALSVEEALTKIKETTPDLILSDLSMPEIDGLEFCRMLKSDQTTREIPFIFITVLNTSKEKEEAFLAGAVDFIPKPFDNVEVIMRVNNHLSIYRLRQEMTDYNRMMHKLVEDQKNLIEKTHVNVLRALISLLKKKDPALGPHRSRVGYNSKILAQGLQFSPAHEDEITDAFVEAIGVAARLHDVGRFVIGEEAPETDPEHTYIKKCVEEGTAFLTEFGTEQEEDGALGMAQQIASCCYARWDGSGYPSLGGVQIPLAARIVAAANDFDRLILPEEGGTALSVEEGVEHLTRNSGTLYDPDVVQVFQKLVGRMRTN